MGTGFDPDAQKASGQVLHLWLANSLQPSIPFAFRVVNHPQGRVVLLEIPAATFAEMTPDERVRACYFHAVLKFLSGDKMKNATLCVRLGIDPKNASQSTGVINKTLAAGLIRVADLDHPRAGYVPYWA